MSIYADLQQAAIPDQLVELYQLDLTSLGGPIFYLTPTTVNGTTAISFGGQTYTPFPITGDGWESSIDGALPQPTLKISNVVKFIQSYLTQYGDLVGARLTRFFTLSKYLDAASFSTRNLLVNTEGFNNTTYWARNQTALTVNAINSPTGTLTADKLTMNSTTTRTFYVQQAISASASSPVTFSVFGKAAEVGNIFLSVSGKTTTANVMRGFFNLNTGSFTESIGSTATLIDSGIVDYTNGWYRVWVCVNVNASDTQVNCLVGIANSTVTGLIGDYYFPGTTGNGLYLWGAQAETTQSPTPYQPVIGTTIQSTADSTQVFN